MYFVFCIQYIAFQEAFTQDDILIAPKRSINCGSFSQNIKDYTISYDTLVNTCASISFTQILFAQQMSAYISNVQRTMTLNNMQRYSQYNIQLSNNKSLTTEQKNQLTTSQRSIVEAAYTGYNTIATKYQLELKTLLDKLNPTSTMQSCQTTAQTAHMSQMHDANLLMATPNLICNQLKSAYANYEKLIFAIYTKIGAAIST